VRSRPRCPDRSPTGPGSPSTSAARRRTDGGRRRRDGGRRADGPVEHARRLAGPGRRAAARLLPL
jgi:hypothetical protein